MFAEENKALARRVYESFNKHDFLEGAQVDYGFSRPNHGKICQRLQIGNNIVVVTLISSHSQSGEI